MQMDIGAKLLFILAICLGLQSLNSSAVAQQLSPSQIVKPTDLTPKELNYYQQHAGEAEVAKNFLITRSYVRLCQQVIDKKLPATKLPDKPLGFSVRYLLPGEANMINEAIAQSVAAMMLQQNKT